MCKESWMTVLVLYILTTLDYKAKRELKENTIEGKPYE